MATISGHMIVKNGVKYDYPFLQSCESILPICKEFVFVEGEGDDGTYEAILEFQKRYRRVRIIRRPWQKQHYSILSDLTNVAIEDCKCDYHFQIQADEVVHEQYLKTISDVVNRNNFDFMELGVLHFYGSFRKVYKPNVFYDHFIRLARRSTYPQLRSYDDAMSLGCPDFDSSRLVKLSRHDIKVHHYGYVRKPMALINKQDEAIKWWGIQERDHLFQHALDTGRVDWGVKHTPDRLDDYTDEHPGVLREWIADRELIVERGILEGFTPGT